MQPTNSLGVLQRLQAPTPKFFTVLRRVGLVLAGVGAAIVASPVLLPASVAAVGGYLITAGAVAAAVSQLTTRSEP